MIRIVKKIITYILTLVLFILFSTMIFILSCKTLITKENLSNYVKSVDILNVDLGIIFNLEKSSTTKTLRRGLSSCCVLLAGATLSFIYFLYSLWHAEP